MKRYIFLLMTTAILVTGCTSTSKLKQYTGSNGDSYTNNTGIKLKASERNKKESFKTHRNKDKSIADTDPDDTDTGTDTNDTTAPDTSDTNPDDTNVDNTTDNQLDGNDVEGFDPSTGVYGPGT